MGAGKTPRARIVGFATVALMVAIGVTGLSQAAPGTPTASPPALPASSPMATPAASPVTSDGGTFQANIVVGEITIELTDSGFSPVHFESAVGLDVTIHLVNTGSRRHNFTLDAFDVDVDLAPGEKRTVTIKGPRLGEYPYRSDTPGDEDFSGVMVIFI